jgi:hypothetical protein
MQFKEHQYLTVLRIRKQHIARTFPSIKGNHFHGTRCLALLDRFPSL